MDDYPSPEFGHSTTEYGFRLLKHLAETNPERLGKILEPFITKVIASLTTGAPRLEWRIEKGGLVTLICLFGLLKEKGVGFISPKENMENFIAHFLKGGEIIAPIRWQGALNQLAYLMNCLLDYNHDDKDERFKDGYIKYVEGKMNKIILTNFVGENGNTFDTDSLRSLRNNPKISAKDAAPVDELIKKLDRKLQEFKSNPEA